MRRKNRTEIEELKTKSKEYDRLIEIEERELNKKIRAVEAKREHVRHIELEVEMLTLEIEMLMKKQDRELDEGYKAFEELMAYVIQEWRDEKQRKKEEMKQILEMFCELGERGEKVAMKFLKDEGFSQDFIEEVAPQFKNL